MSKLPFVNLLAHTTVKIGHLARLVPIFEDYVQEMPKNVIFDMVRPVENAMYAEEDRLREAGWRKDELEDGYRRWEVKQSAPEEPR